MKKLLFPFAIVALALAGCAKDATLESKRIEIVDPNPPAKDPDVISFFAQLPAKFSKTTTMAETKKTYWNQDDAVYITDGKLGSVYTAIKAGKDTTILNHFAGDTLAIKLGQKYYAYFPAEIAAYDGQTGTIGLPSARSWSGFDRFLDSPMVAEKVRYTPDGVQTYPQDTLNFKNLCGVLKINLCEPTSIQNNYPSIVLKNIELYANEPVCGPATITMGSEPSVVLEPNKEPIVIDCRKELRLTTAAQPVYVYLPEGNYSGMELYYNSSNYEDTGFATIVVGSVEIKRGAVTDLNVDLGMEPESYSIDQTSNCMVVNSIGKFAFKPTKAETGESVGKIDHALIVWEQVNSDLQTADNQLITNISYNAEKDSVYFTISTYPDYGGNALIGVADKEGKILWSYHIWLYYKGADPGVLSYDKAGQYQVKNVSLGGGATLTSWNGSSSVYLSQNLHYQYGRKDPFPGQLRDYSKGAFKYAGMKRSPEQGPVSMERATNNPASYYYSDEGSEWCDNPSEATWDGPTKSVNDPCPYGYRVMDVAAFSGDYFTSLIVRGNRGIMFYDNDIYAGGTNLNCVQINFANSSLIKGEDGTFTTGNKTYCWTRSAGETEGTSKAFHSPSGSSWEIQDGKHTNGYPVRCQLINPTVE